MKGSGRTWEPGCG